MKTYIKNDKIIIIDIAVIDYMNEGFELTDKAGNHIESEMGYRCVLSVADGEVVYKDSYHGRTHVFVNDPTRGYGIFIENMLSEAEKMK